MLVHGFASNKEVNWVYPGWVSTLARAGRRVIALDNRGHGASTKFYDPAAYHSSLMAEDVRALLDHLEISRADVMGYSLGSRITASLRSRIRSGCVRRSSAGIGIHLVDGPGLSRAIAAASRRHARRRDRSARAHVSRLRRADALGPGCARRLHPWLAADDCARRTRGSPCRFWLRPEQDDIAGSPVALAALVPAPRRLSFPDAITCSRWAIGYSTPASWNSWHNAHDVCGVSQWPYYISARGRFSRGH